MTTTTDTQLLHGQIITPLDMAVLEVVVGVRKPFQHDGISGAVAALVGSELLEPDMSLQVLPTEAGIRATAPRFMKVIN